MNKCIHTDVCKWRIDVNTNLLCIMDNNVFQFEENREKYKRILTDFCSLCKKRKE